MKLAFFAVPAIGGADAGAEVNRFLGSHRVVAIDRQLVSAEGGAYWALCVTHLEGTSEPAVLKRGKIDYRESLSEADFAVYSRLRVLRKQIAERDALPVYALFTNEQLAAMVVQQVRTTAELSAIPGVGPARVERYSAAFLDVLRKTDERPEGDGDG